VLKQRRLGHQSKCIARLRLNHKRVLMSFQPTAFSLQPDLQRGNAGSESTTRVCHGQQS
jgi:hypothetical protein